MSVLTYLAQQRSPGNQANPVYKNRGGQAERLSSKKKAGVPIDDELMNR